MSSRQISEIKGYTPAQLCKGVSWYIYFSVWNPESENMKRIRIKLDSLNSPCCKIIKIKEEFVENEIF